MPDESILFKSSCRINDNIEIIIPTVEDILNNELEYYSMVSSLTAMPIDMMVQLADLGIDFTEINEYQLFQILFIGLQNQDASMIFGDLDLTLFEPYTNPQNGEFCFYDFTNNIMIDESIHNLIATTLRKIHHLEKNNRKPGNEAAKSYMIEKERKRLRRRKNKPYESKLEPLIVAMVNSEPYKYDFEGTKRLSIYQFNMCVRQVIRKTDWNNRMSGIYAGTISPKDMSEKELSWIGD
jgi:hypothetical protein